MSNISQTIIAMAAALGVAVAFLLSERMQAGRQPWPDELLRVQLDRRIEGEIEFVGTLEGALRRLIDKGVALNVRWDQLKGRSALEPTAKQISIRMRDATVDQWLTAIEFQIDGTSFVHWLDAEAGIHVTSHESQDPPRVGRVFDVRDIIEDACAFSSLFPIQRFRLMGGTSWEVDEPHEAAGRDLIALVRAVTGRGTWDYAATGSRPSWGRSGMTDGRMIITQTPQVQREMEVLLSVLRSSSAPDDRGK